MDEARINTAEFFRPPGGNPGNVNYKNGKPYNGKFNSSSNTVCTYFNRGKDHPANALHPDGSCKFKHVCNKWVTNKGKSGRCMGSEGTPGHYCLTCDNPHRCDEPVGA